MYVCMYTCVYVPSVRAFIGGGAGGGYMAYVCMCRVCVHLLFVFVLGHMLTYVCV
jgi:hypothetical protein